MTCDSITFRLKNGRTVKVAVSDCVVLYFCDRHDQGITVSAKELLDRLRERFAYLDN